jgi:phosphoglycolate phosphatase
MNKRFIAPSLGQAVEERKRGLRRDSGFSWRGNGLRLWGVKHGVIFDLDGTLLDSLPGIADSLNRTLDAHGLPGHSHARVRSFVGDGLRNLILRAAPKGADPALIESLLTLYRKDYHLTWQHGTTVYPGIAGMLAELQGSGFNMAVLSNKVHDFTVTMVREIFPEIHFAKVLGQREGVPHKPDPTGALQIAMELDLAPPACVVVGDSTMDVETAANAGMRAVAVSWGYHDRDRLTAAGAQWVIDVPDELPPLLQRMEA